MKALELAFQYMDIVAACLIYEFSKSGIITPMMQLFEVYNGEIHKILLIFDSKMFA